MPDIYHTFPISAPRVAVFLAISTPAGLNAWWTLTAHGWPEAGVTYDLGFGPAHQWKGKVTRYVPGTALEWELTVADEDWKGTRVGFLLSDSEFGTQVEFYHRGWAESNDHYRISTFCWAMYLRMLRKYIETGIIVPYEERLDA